MHGVPHLAEQRHPECAHATLQLSPFEYILSNLNIGWVGGWTGITGRS